MEVTKQNTYRNIKPKVNAPKEKKSLLSRIRWGRIAVAATAIGLIYGASTDRIEEKTLPYQGHTSINGEVSLVFDEDKKYMRNGDAPELFLKGDKEGLEIGKTYTVEYSVPEWESFFPKKLKKVKPIK